MIQESASSRSAYPGPSPRRVDRRRLLGASAGVALAGAGLVRPLRAQSLTTSPAEHNPFQPGSDSAAGGPDGPTRLLAYVPRGLIEKSAESGVHWYYADIAQQFKALGVPHSAVDGEADDAGWIAALTPLATASSAFQYARVEEFIDAIGFQPLGVDQTLFVGAPPEQLTIFRADFDASRLESAWEASGYVRESASGGQESWTIGPDGGFKIDNPIQRVVFAAFNNIVRVEDDLLLCAPTQYLLEEALAAKELGKAASSDPFFVSALSTLPATTVSAMSVSPSGIGFSASTTPEMEGEFDGLIERSDAEVGAMPRYEGLVTALGAGAVATEGDGGAGEAMVRIVTSSPADAEQVLAVVEFRWTEGTSLRTSQPYTDLMAITGMSVDGNVAKIDFEQLRSPAVWRDMIFSRDALPFIPSPGS